MKFLMIYGLCFLALVAFFLLSFAIPAITCPWWIPVAVYVVGWVLVWVLG